MHIITRIITERKFMGRYSYSIEFLHLYHQTQYTIMYMRKELISYPLLSFKIATKKILSVCWHGESVKIASE